MRDNFSKIFGSTDAINTFLVAHALRIKSNPCVSPDFCLDWPSLRSKIDRGVTLFPWAYSEVTTAVGTWLLLEDQESGDHVWQLTPCTQGVGSDEMTDGMALSSGAILFPATFQNLLRLKNLVQYHNPESTIFPSAGGDLGVKTLGIGARFTTHHWPAVEWAMSKLELGVTANQNSIPRELVYDVNAMLGGKLDTVPFPFIGTNVPEGHQGQSVEGMSHGCILSKLKTGFHRRGIPWSFNADHQPIGGKFDSREDRLVAGCILASYITFDLSPELAQSATQPNPRAWVMENVPRNIYDGLKEALFSKDLEVPDEPLEALLAYVWPAINKMKERDRKYKALRSEVFTTAVGREYLRELSIDELPGLTTPETTAVMLALCEALEMKINFIAPAFGFQKNLPYSDNDQLRSMIEEQWRVCSAFGVSIGFHSGSGKSAENYQIMGEVTEQCLEIKTSGRYTYEMGRALSLSSIAADRELWRDWYQFTVALAVKGAFSTDATEQKMARSFIGDALDKALGRSHGSEVFASAESCRMALEALTPSPEHMFWFEYNFLYVLAAEGKAEKSALGDHSPAGYAQRARFYSISPEAKLEYAKNVAKYIIFLAENTGLQSAEQCAAATVELDRYRSIEEMLEAIAG